MKYLIIWISSFTDRDKVINSHKSTSAFVIQSVVGLAICLGFVCHIISNCFRGVLIKDEHSISSFKLLALVLFVSSADYLSHSCLLNLDKPASGGLSNPLSHTHSLSSAILFHFHSTRFPTPMAIVYWGKGFKTFKLPFKYNNHQDSYRGGGSIIYDNQSISL